MTVARHYVMHAAEGKDAALEKALSGLAEVVRKIDGCTGVEMMRDCGNERRFVFIEKWTSVDAHKEGAKSVDKSIFGPMMAALDGPPEGAYLDYLKTL